MLQLFKLSKLHFSKFLSTTNGICRSNHFATNSTRIQKVNQSVDKDGYKYFYVFKQGNFAAVLSRMKIYQTIVSCGLLSLVGKRCYDNFDKPLSIKEKAAIIPGITLCIAAPIAFTVYSYITRRFIVLMQLNKETQKVKIAHMNFWGNRTDIDICAKSLPLLTKEDGKKILINIKPIDNSNIYSMTLHKTKLDKDVFNSIFGKEALREFLEKNKL